VVESEQPQRFNDLSQSWNDQAGKQTLIQIVALE
jgi:hypothetical protein